MQVTRVIGVKRNGARNFVVVDGSMTEVIRPSLYDAFHFVDFASGSAFPPFHMFAMCSTAL